MKTQAPGPLALLAVLALGAPSARAAAPAAHVQAHLYARAADDGKSVRAALVLDVDQGWHIYHEDLGSAEAVGVPTRVELAAPGVTWGAVRFPEPESLDQGLTDAKGREIHVLAHAGHVVLYAVGGVAAGGADAAAAAATARVSGQACAQACVPLSLSLTSEGRGPDALFAGFPADLAPPAGAATNPAAPATGPPPAREPDERSSGHADATLFARTEGRHVRVAIRIVIDPGWHLYHASLGNPEAIGKPTMVEFAGSSHVRWGDVQWPEPEQAGQGLTGSDGEEIWVLQHEGTIVLHAEGDVIEGQELGPLEVHVSGLTCQDDGQCVPYEETIYPRGPGPDALFPTASAVATTPPSGAGTTGTGTAGGATTQASPAAGGSARAAPWSEEELRGAGLGKFLLFAVLAGLFALVMPCTYPMIPITISFFTKQADARGGKVLPLALAYGAGIVLVFVLIGVVIGPPIRSFASNPITNLVIAVAFLYFALVLFGVFQLEPPRFLMRLAGEARSVGGFAGVFLMGTTLVITSFTCTAPFVGTLLAMGAGTGDIGRIALGMSVFGLTMAIPFVLLSLLPGKIQNLPRSGEWMNTLKVSLGFIELAAAFKFLSNSDLSWKWFVLSYEVFLFLWAAIFLALAVYLLGAFHRGHGKVGGKRIAFGVLSAVFALYLAWGGAGHKLDRITMAIAPPYSGGVLMRPLYVREHPWTTIVDDYGTALARAKQEKKLLLVNFTGYTCVNCRQMEENVFPAPRIARELVAGFIEARLHTDGDKAQQLQELQQRMTGGLATPYYVIVDPATGKELRVQAGATFSEDTFLAFLTGSSDKVADGRTAP